MTSNMWRSAVCLKARPSQCPSRLSYVQLGHWKQTKKASVPRPAYFMPLLRFRPFGWQDEMQPPFHLIPKALPQTPYVTRDIIPIEGGGSISHLLILECHAEPGIDAPSAWGPFSSRFCGLLCFTHPRSTLFQTCLLTHVLWTPCRRFRESGNTLRRKMCWELWKMRLIVAFIVCMVIMIIVLLICFAGENRCGSKDEK